MKKNPMFILMSVMLFLGACGGQVAAFGPTPTSSVVPPTVEVKAQGEMFPINVHEQARDVALAYVAERAGLPLPDGEWAFQDQTPQDSMGISTWLFTNGPWVVQVSAPVLAPQSTVYSITIDHISAIIRWEGTVDSFGEILETNLIQGPSPEVPNLSDENSWIGAVVSNPPGSQFDDYFQVLDQNGTRYGIDGGNDAIREQLSKYRDTGVLIQIWGNLQKDVMDAYGTQILATRVEPYSQ